MTRKEDQRLLTGHGLYVDDVKVSGTLHAAFLRSDLARAAISRVDTSVAKEMPGVVAVYTWEDFNGITGPGYHAMLGEELVVPPPLAITDVRYVGDPVAVVIADTRYLAEDACEAIEVDYEPQQAVVDYMTASADTENIVHAGWGLESNAMAAVPFMPLSPDLDDAFASAAHVVECDVVQNRYVAMPMETRGIWCRTTRAGRSSTSCARRSRCTRPGTSSLDTCRSRTATCASPRATSAAASGRRCSCIGRSARSRSPRSSSGDR